MYVIGLVHSKGGTGKSTIAVNLARALQLRGAAVVVIDTDPQGTAQNWKASNTRGDDLPPVFGVTKAGALQQDVRRLSKAFDVAVIDGKAHLQAMDAAIIKTADLVLIPVQPSPADIWPTEAIVEMIQARRMVADKPAAAFVVSRRKPGTNLSAGVEDVLQRFGLPVWAGTHDRVAYAQAIGQGLGVVDMNDRKAAAEIDTLTAHVIDTLTHEQN